MENKKKKYFDKKKFDLLFYFSPFSPTYSPSSHSLSAVFYTVQTLRSYGKNYNNDCGRRKLRVRTLSGNVLSRTG